MRPIFSKCIIYKILQFCSCLLNYSRHGDIIYKFCPGIKQIVSQFIIKLLYMGFDPPLGTHWFFLSIMCNLSRQTSPASFSIQSSVIIFLSPQACLCSWLKKENPLFWQPFMVSITPHHCGFLESVWSEGAATFSTTVSLTLIQLHTTRSNALSFL